MITAVFPSELVAPGPPQQHALQFSHQVMHCSHSSDSVVVLFVVPEPIVWVVYYVLRVSGDSGNGSHLSSQRLSEDDDEVSTRPGVQLFGERVHISIRDEVESIRESRLNKVLDLASLYREEHHLLRGEIYSWPVVFIDVVRVGRIGVVVVGGKIVDIASDSACPIVVIG